MIQIKGNCFRKAGFVLASGSDDDDGSVFGESDDDVTLLGDEFLNVDKQLQICSEDDIESDIIEAISSKKQKNNFENSDDHSDEDEEVVLPSTNDLLRSFSEGERFFTHIGEFAFANKAKDLFKAIQNHQNAHLNQTKISDFFSK